jgi:hypothetical protein
MKTLLLCLALCLAGAATAQEKNYANDVKTADDIVKALYEVISGSSNEPRDWERFKFLFTADARLIPTYKDKEGKTGYRILTPADYSTMFTSRITTGFYERELHRVTEEYANVVHVFSTYETAEIKGGPATQRGINSIQLLKTDDRFFIMNVFWSSETPQHPVPARYLGK